MLGKAIYSILSNDTTLSDMIGTSIFPVRAPQRTARPFVVYRENNTVPTNHADGAAPKDLKSLQIDIYSATYTEAHEIADQIRVLLDAYAGTVAGVKIRQMWFSTQDDGDYLEDMDFYGISQVYEARIKR